MREVIGRTPIQPALTELRAQIETDVPQQTQQILDNYNAGVEITQVQLQSVDPPAEVVESFRDVQRANTDAERMRNEAEAYRNDIVPRARGDAARIVAEGQGAEAGLDRPGDRADAALPVGARAIRTGKGCDAAAHVHRDDAGHPDAFADAGGGRQAEGPGAVPAAQSAGAGSAEISGAQQSPSTAASPGPSQGQPGASR